MRNMRTTITIEWEHLENDIRVDINPQAQERSTGGGQAAVAAGVVLAGSISQQLSSIALLNFALGKHFKLYERFPSHTQMH